MLPGEPPRQHALTPGYTRADTADTADDTRDAGDTDADTAAGGPRPVPWRTAALADRPAGGRAKRRAFAGRWRLR